MWLLLLAACEVATFCTEIGCAGELVLTVVGPPGTGEVSGLVTVDGTDFVVDCDGAGDPAVTCTGDTLRIQLGDDVGEGPVTWTLSSSPRDTGGGGGYAGEGSVTPDWSRTQPNGDGCPPVCWYAAATVELLGTP